MTSDPGDPDDEDSSDPDDSPVRYIEYRLTIYIDIF